MLRYHESGQPGMIRLYAWATALSPLCDRRVPAVAGQRLQELAARGDAELAEDVAQVPFDRPRGQEQLGADLPVGQARPGQPGDLGLLRGELVVRGDGALADGLAGGPQLAAGPVGERLHADLGGHLVRGAQLRPRVGPPALAAQPLAVDQVRAGKLKTNAGAAQLADRLAIPGLGVPAVAEQ